MYHYYFFHSKRCKSTSNSPNSQDGTLDNGTVGTYHHISLSLSHRLHTLLPKLLICRLSLSWHGCNTFWVRWLSICPFKFAQYINTIWFLLISNGISFISTCNAATGVVLKAPQQSLFSKHN